MTYQEHLLMRLYEQKSLLKFNKKVGKIFIEVLPTTFPHRFAAKGLQIPSFQKPSAQLHDIFLFLFS